MPLTIPGVEARLKDAMLSNLKQEMGPDTSKGADYEAVANAQLDKMAGAIAKAVAKVIVEALTQDAEVAPGIPVATAGGPAAQAGATTAPGRIV